MPLVAGARILFADVLSAVLIAVTVPLIPVFMVLIGRMTERRTARQWAVLQRLGGHFLDVIEGMPTLRLFGRAEAQRDSVHEVSEQYRATTLGALRIAFLSALALELIATLSVALIAVEIGLRLAGGSLDLEYGAGGIAPDTRVLSAVSTGRVRASTRPSRVSTRPTISTSCSLAHAADRRTVRPEHRRARSSGCHAAARRSDGPRRARPRHRPGTLTAVYGPSGDRQVDPDRSVPSPVARTVGSIAVAGVDINELDPASWADQLTVIGQRLVQAAPSSVDEVRAATSASDEVVLAALADVGLTADRAATCRRALGRPAAARAGRPGARGRP